MKLFTTPAIKRDLFGYEFTAHRLKRSHVNDGYSDRYWFCATEVCRIFRLPLNTTKVWFEFHDRAGANRWRVHVTDERLTNDDAIVKVDGVGHRISGYTARFLIKRLGCTKCFVACYYETKGRAPESETVTTGTTATSAVLSPRR